MKTDEGVRESSIEVWVPQCCPNRSSNHRDTRRNWGPITGREQPLKLKATRCGLTIRYKPSPTLRRPPSSIALLSSLTCAIRNVTF
jgi:hypothetical protein